ncbi:MAG: hypothetical protein FWF97_00005, partial [Alphaproteobacteria bacterium]|nr:hypothetical protein [Alphaproteobacteria bacterium]
MRKLILTSLAALFAVGAANAALLPEPGVVSTTTYNAKVGDSADLGDLGDGVVIPAIMEIKDAISDESGDIINLGDEITIITNALGNKQDKLTAGAARNTAAGKVAIWGGTLGGTDGTGQTEGAVEMITDYSGIVENATGLTTV